MKRTNVNSKLERKKCYGESEQGKRRGEGWVMVLMIMIALTYPRASEMTLVCQNIVCIGSFTLYTIAASGLFPNL